MACIYTSDKRPIQNIHCSFTSVHVQTNVILSSCETWEAVKTQTVEEAYFCRMEETNNFVRMLKVLNLATLDDDYFEVSVCIYHGSKMNHC